MAAFGSTAPPVRVHDGWPWLLQTTETQCQPPSQSTRQTALDNHRAAPGRVHSHNDSLMTALSCECASPHTHAPHASTHTDTGRVVRCRSGRRGVETAANTQPAARLFTGPSHRDASSTRHVAVARPVCPPARVSWHCSSRSDIKRKSTPDCESPRDKNCGGGGGGRPRGSPGAL